MSTKAAHYRDLERKFGAHNYHPLEEPVISSAKGIWVKDIKGIRYLDMLSAYSAMNLGHRHPKVTAAAKNQLNKLTLTSRAFINDQLGLFEEKVARVTKKQAVLPMNTGAEAVETAIKAARKWGYTRKGVVKNKAEIIVCDGNFHGRTTTIVGFSSEEQYKAGFGPFASGFISVPYGDIDALKRAITPNTIGFLVEPIQGEAGVVMPPDGYLQKAAALCRAKKVLFIADEIQTGLGRTGKMFACDHENVVPDIYILGKALGGGIYPVSAIAADRDIMDVFTPGDHGSTFGGNPLGAAIAVVALETLMKEQLAKNAAKMGDYFMSQLQKIRSPFVKEVRGKGLLIGVQLRPEAGGARRFCEALAKKRILAKETHEDVIRFAPPLIITRDDIDWALERIARVLLK